LTQQLSTQTSTGSAISGEPLVSVIVTTYAVDRLKDIEHLLDSLQAQSYPNLEIIFVGERDRELCDYVTSYAHGRGIRNLKAVFNDGQTGLSPARNVGIAHAKGEIIAFLDDDAIAFPDWVEEAVNSLTRDDGPIGVTGPAFPIWEDKSMSWFPDEFFWIISCSTPGSLEQDEAQTVRNVWGVNMGFRREAFQHCSFDERLGGNMGAVDGSKLGLLGEDTLFSIRIREETGRPIIHNSRLKVFHKVYSYRFKSRFVRRRAFWEGYTKAWLKKLHQRDGRPDANVLATEYRLLRRIALSFFPRVMIGFARDPARSWRQLCLAVDVLAHVALGYASAIVGPLGRVLCRRYGQ
jgi:glycosyltransferase involved in cell wall biosynthesis